ncbi:secondary thiamine-phosphate synthase enzyme [Geothermobacter ehrlichii]|uniref:Secondary thiamine-phosphate synthase enzyme n=1 Tax=Geothermobacter ehrlichii TaxID=213224 RepID=A0A5D3WJ34_9BACT|nr:secondary thiamine-phosphate synthase enzyme YjbQ [Geothermobacter ehrlichii]TYO98285.1 secondary thiamine-phosphate synthase enzyme [Geothermobacter ehrlichii]
MITLEVSSGRQVEMIDITAQVRQAVAESGIRSGLLLVFTPHTTAAVTINENADPDVPHDLVMELNRIVPFEDGYRHVEGNSAAHLKSSLIGAGETIPVEDGRPVLGTWQGIWFCEFDGPRRRKVHLQIIGR